MIDELRDFFLLAAALNMGLLFLSVVIQALLRRHLNSLMNQVFNVSEEKTNEIICKAIVFQKIVTYVFFIIPALALWIMKQK